MRAADLLINCLVENGVRHIFSLSGNQIMPIYDAWIDSPIELLHVRHEAAAVHMANTWGQLTGQPGVALVTAGPGLANTLSALFDARAAEAPLLLISGAAPLKDDGRAPFQALPAVELTAAVCKASWRVEDGAQLANMVDEALRIASSGRPGPVNLTIPVDILKSEVEPAGPPTPQTTPQQPLTQWARQIETALRQAKTPLIIVGQAAKRTASFQEFCHICQAKGLPVLYLENARGCYDGSQGALAQMIPQADLIVLLGQQLDFTLKMGDDSLINAGAKLIQVDPDEEVLAVTKRNAGERQILLLEQGDVAQLLERLASTLAAGSPIALDWAKSVDKALNYRPAAWATIQSTPMHPAQLSRAIDDFLPAQADHLLIADGGDFTQWLRACVQAPSRLSNGPSGSIGTAVALANAARLARPDARIVACSGDGGFGFHPFELDTAVRYQLPYVFVVANDACWNAERQVQIRDYGADRIKGVDLAPTAYHEVARALGGWGAEVHQAEDLPEALLAAEQSGLPAVVNVHIQSVAAPYIRLPGG